MPPQPEKRSATRKAGPPTDRRPSSRGFRNQDRSKSAARSSVPDDRGWRRRRDRSVAASYVAVHPAGIDTVGQPGSDHSRIRTRLRLLVEPHLYDACHTTPLRTPPSGRAADRRAHTESIESNVQPLFACPTDLFSNVLAARTRSGRVRRPLQMGSRPRVQSSTFETRNAHVDSRHWIDEQGILEQSWNPAAVMFTVEPDRRWWRLGVRA